MSDRHGWNPIGNGCSEQEGENSQIENSSINVLYYEYIYIFSGRKQLEEQLSMYIY